MCVKARGREDPHRAQTERKADLELPQISMDYAEIGNDQEEGEARKLLVGRDRQSKFTFCHLVKCKGTGDERIVKKVMESIRETGSTKMVLKTFWGTSNCTVAGQVITEQNTKPYHRIHQHTIRKRMVKLSGAVQDVKAQLRAVKLGLEARIGEKINVNCPVMEWMIPHAAQTIHRFQVGEDGRTGHYRLHLKEFWRENFRIR